MIVEVLQAVVAVLMGCLIGMLAYLVPAALSLGRPVMAAPRAVVRVPERLCHSIRCCFLGTAEHLVEVEILEKTTRFVKVRWPHGYGHLDPWIQIAEIPESPTRVDAVRVLEELPAYPLWSSSEFEHWLSTVGANLDALEPATEIEQRG